MKRIILLTIATICSLYVAAMDLQYRVRAGYNLGGTAPIGLPVEVRKINSFKPTLNLTIEGDVQTLFSEHWGVSTGLRFETKGMKTSIVAKNYWLTTTIEGNQEPASGYFSGDISTKINNSYLTVPLLALCKPSERWELRGGIYLSYLLDGEFDGNVSNGYIRENTPTSPKIPIKQGRFDYMNHVHSFDYGIQLGADYLIYKSLAFYADFTWGLRPVLSSNAEAIRFKLYNLYLNLGVAYHF